MVQSSKGSSKGKKNIFVTVGTTQFDALVSSVISTQALEWMKQQGYTSLTIQYGKGRKPNFVVGDINKSHIPITMYDFRSSLEEDMKNADLIISHAGAGTVMEALRLNKKLVVVINTLLMNNHQTELASAMAQRDHLYMVETPEDMIDIETWKSFQDFVPVPHQEGDEYDFPRLLDSFLGYSENKSD